MIGIPELLILLMLMTAVLLLVALGIFGFVFFRRRKQNRPAPPVLPEAR